MGKHTKFRGQFHRKITSIDKSTAAASISGPMTSPHHEFCPGLQYQIWVPPWKIPEIQLETSQLHMQESYHYRNSTHLPGILLALTQLRRTIGDNFLLQAFVRLYITTEAN